MNKMKTRYDLINYYAQKYGYKKYLEIGVAEGRCFDKVQCPVKVGIDPEVNGSNVYKMTSDEFFCQNEREFDIIFIDGLHLWEQVYTDIIDSLTILSKNGTIICHDMNPQREERQRREKITECWNGDCWKAWVYLRDVRDDLDMRVYNIDQGCGVIRRGEQKLLTRSYPLEYEYLDKNRDEWLNLVKIQ